MRGKVAKALRKKARELSQGMPARYLVARNFEKKVKVTNPKHPDFGKTIDVTMQCAVNHPQSTRGIYRQLKALFKRGITV